MHDTKHRLAIGLLLVLAGCSGTEARLPTDMPSDTGGGEVHRASLSIAVMIDARDSSIARHLGWQGAVPGATVTAQRIGSGASVSAITDSTGVAQFSGLLPGTFVVSASRILGSSERARLPASASDVDAFGSGMTIVVQAPRTSGTVTAAAGRRGSLIISEVWSGNPWQPNGNQYSFGNYIELYNNGDLPVSLPGLLIFSGYGGTYHNPPWVTCEAASAFQRDPDGLWTTFAYAFPPSAGTVQPGRTILLATDAIDHTALASGTFDLSTSDFEFRGSADVDNPSVADMLSVGPSDGGDLRQHGMMIYGRPVIGIASSVDPASLPRQLDSNARPWMRVPRDVILDVISFLGYQSGTATLCPQPVHPEIDRQELMFTNLPEENSLQRPFVTTLPNGNKVLLRTRNSARDFQPGAPSPGMIP
jgi:hypothetical protein